MADGSGYPNYFLTIPSWPSSSEDEEKLFPFETTAPESESDDEVSSLPKPHVTFETAFKKLAEGDIFADSLEGTVISVDFRNLQNWEDLGYAGPEEEREFYLRPPLKDFLLKDQKLQALFEFLMAAPEEMLDAQVELARKHGATFSFSQAATDAGVPASTPVLAQHPVDAPPLWAERTTGREVSPVAWIRMHYGNKDPNPDNWDPMGLTSSDLRQSDRALYQAYASWISRKSSDGLDLPKLTPITFGDPAEQLEYKRKIERMAETRYRAKKRKFS
jgi:hypothetical protein